MGVGVLLDTNLQPHRAAVLSPLSPRGYHHKEPDMADQQRKDGAVGVKNLKEVGMPD